MQLFKKKAFGTETNALMISNKEIENIIEVIKSLEQSGLLLKGVIKTIKKTN